MKASKKTIRKPLKAGTKRSGKVQVKAKKQNGGIVADMRMRTNSSTSQTNQTQVNVGRTGVTSFDSEPVESIRVYPKLPAYRRRQRRAVCTRVRKHIEIRPQTESLAGVGQTLVGS
jgi:hypothetical protein